MGSSAPTRFTKLPKLCRDKVRDRGFVWLRRKRHYLGRWGTSDAIVAYQRLCAEIYGARNLETPPEATVVEVITAHDLLSAYADWARGTFIKRGEPTKRARSIARVRDLILQRGFGSTRVAEICPAWLREFRASLASDHKDRWSRRTINDYAEIIVAACRYGQEYDLIDPGPWDLLRVVTPLRRGRPAEQDGAIPRESVPVTSAPRAWVQAARRLLPRALRIMVTVQLLTGARPGEVCALRVGDLKPTRLSGVRVYTVRDDDNKSDHANRKRRIYFGPRSLRLIEQLTRGLDAREFVFSPKRSEIERLRLRREARRLPRWPSHDPALRNDRTYDRARPMLNDRYTTSSYRRAIVRACERARVIQASRGVPTEERCGKWTPHQLRHTRATQFADLLGMELARDLLGHASVKTTERYVHASDRRPARAALRLA